MIRKLDAIVERQGTPSLFLQHADDGFGGLRLGPARNAASQKEPGATIDQRDQMALLAVHGVAFPVAQPAARICRFGPIVNRAIALVSITPALESIGAFVGLEGPLKVLVDCPALLVVPSQPAIERACGNPVRNTFQRHSAGDHFRTQFSLDISRDPGPELVVEFGVLVGAGPAEIACLLGSARAVIAPGASIELPVDGAAVAVNPFCRLGGAEPGCQIALYLISLIESQLSVSVCHDT